MMSKIYQQLHALVRSRLLAYETDLEKHDKEAIEESPGVPFLHWTRDSGTHIVMLWDMKSDVWPMYGVRVPYLFRTADRNHILDGMILMAEWHLMPSNGGDKKHICHYYDGVRIRPVTCAKAVEIVKEYARPLRRAWEQERIKHEDPQRYREMRDAGQLCA
jgi:hypothetical protein